MPRRFAEYHDLEGAFARGALIERAAGILMERHTRIFVDGGEARLDVPVRRP